MWNVEWFDHSGRNMLEVTNRTLLQKLMKKNNKTNRKTMKYQQGHYMERTLYRAKKVIQGALSNWQMSRWTKQNEDGDKKSKISGVYSRRSKAAKSRMHNQYCYLTIFFSQMLQYDRMVPTMKMTTHYSLYEFKSIVGLTSWHISKHGY